LQSHTIAAGTWESAGQGELDTRYPQRRHAWRFWDRITPPGGGYEQRGVAVTEFGGTGTRWPHTLLVLTGRGRTTGQAPSECANADFYTLGPDTDTAVTLFD